MDNVHVFDTEDVKCVECSRIVKTVKGHLSEEGKVNYRCGVCSEQVLERRVEAKRLDGKKLLID